MTKNDDLENVSKKLSLLIAINLIDNPENMNKSELVGLLTSFDISNTEIADILRIPKTSVEVLKSRNKKKRRK